MIKFGSTYRIFDGELPRVSLIALFLLSSSTLGYEINLTRLFSVTQFYHFAFLIVSLALLGFGASGAFLAIFPNFGKNNLTNKLILTTFFTGTSYLLAYLVTNHVPFDSFSIALGWKYTGALLLHMVVLSLPFFFSGLVVILLINSYPKQVDLVYAVNLSGSAVGCLLAITIPNIFGAVGLVILCTSLALISLIMLIATQLLNNNLLPRYIAVFGLFAVILLIFCSIELLLIGIHGKGTYIMQLNLSPYKGISYALQYPGAEVVYQKWNAYSRVDLVRSKGIRLIPGLSYLSNELPPEQDGLFIDGDDPTPVFRAGVPESITSYLPSAIAYKLRPNAKTLILEPRGGFEIMIAYVESARNIHNAEPNPMVIDAANRIYSLESLENFLISGRSYLKRTRELYDVIVLSLNSSFHPIRSGAYGLGEEYRYTIESFEEAIYHLDTDGMLVLTRWLQTPPSEWLRTFVIAVEALERIGGSPSQQIVAFRSYNTGTLLIKNRIYESEELSIINDFAANRAYDLVYFPGIQEADVNKYNKLPEPIYYQSFISLLDSDSRDKWYKEYPYQVNPPSDDRPFFNQYFKWSQLPQIFAEFGKVWQPFGGAGFVILLIFLFLTIILSTGFILLPTLLLLKSKKLSSKNIGMLVYFAAIGLAFLFVEIPMIQQFILFLDNPSYSLTTVLFSILFFSGVGSRFARKISINKSFAGLLTALVVDILFLRYITNIGLGLPLIFRFLVTILLLAPTGFFMGIPFPKSISIIQEDRRHLIPWVWSINGLFSVVSSVAAALLAISFGFRFLFIVGSLIYLFAWLLIRAQDIRIQSLSL